MAKIGKKTIQSIVRQVEGLLNQYQNQIEEAYTRCEERSFSIALPVRLSPHHKGGTSVSVGIGFVKDRVKDEAGDIVDEDQKDLPFEQSKQEQEEKE